jgi:hypothetical protein
MVESLATQITSVPSSQSAPSVNSSKFLSPGATVHLLLVVGYLQLSKDYLGRSVILSNITRKLCCSTA